MEKATVNSGISSVSVVSVSHNIATVNSRINSVGVVVSVNMNKMTVNNRISSVSVVIVKMNKMTVNNRISSAGVVTVSLNKATVKSRISSVGVVVPVSMNIATMNSRISSVGVVTVSMNKVTVNCRISSVGVVVPVSMNIATMNSKISPVDVVTVTSLTSGSQWWYHFFFLKKLHLWYLISYNWCSVIAQCIMMATTPPLLPTSPITDDAHSSLQRPLAKAPKPHLPIILSDAVVVHPALEAHRYGPLARAALALSHQEAAVDATAEQVLGGIAWDEAVVPGELVQAVDRGDVVARHPPHVPGTVLHLAPLASLVVANDCHLFTWARGGRGGGLD